MQPRPDALVAGNVIEEIPTDNWGAGGETVTAIRERERKARA